MKLKVVVVDLEVSPRARRWIIRTVICGGLLLGGGAVAYAATLHTWKTGEVLQAKDLNDNFTTLEDEIKTLHAAPNIQEQSSTMTISGSLGTDLVYTPISLTLTPGTWLLFGFASVGTTVSADGVQLGFWDATAGGDVADCQSGVGEANGTTLGPVSLSTTYAVTLTTATTYQLKAYRNGGSTPFIGYSQTGLKGDRARMLAIRVGG